MIENKPIIVSKGSPNPLTTNEKRDGSDSCQFMTRRMKVLNKHLMQCITDVLSTELIGQELNELEVRITQVSINALILLLKQSINCCLTLRSELASITTMQTFIGSPNVKTLKEWPKCWIT